MFNLNKDGQRQLDTTLACAVILVLAVALRLYVKISYKTGISSDDYWIIATLFLGLAAQAVVQWGTITGARGLELSELFVLLSYNQDVAIAWIDRTLLSIFISFNLYVTAMLALKMSILCFYRRILFIKKFYRNASLVLIIATVLWYFTGQLIRVFVCRPIDAQWKLGRSQNCLSDSLKHQILLGTTVTETIIDFLILILPLPVALRLHVPKRTKFAVAGIFALGGFATITNIIRCRNIPIANKNLDYFSNTEKWFNIHAVTSVVCACLPIYKPLWNSSMKSAASGIRRWIPSHKPEPHKTLAQSKHEACIPMDNYYDARSLLIADSVSSLSFPEPSLQTQMTDHTKVEMNSDIDFARYSTRPIPKNTVVFSQSADIV